jgi:hypothetical protein
VAGLLALAGGAVAFWVLDVRARFSIGSVGVWAMLFVTFGAVVWLAS